MFTEGRKFGSRVYVAHQYRNQLPEHLQSATMTARTKVCFQTTQEDSREMALLFVSHVTEVKPEHIDPQPVKHLLTYGSDNTDVQTFLNWYLRPLRAMPRKERMIEVTTWKMDLALDVAMGTMGYYVKEKPKVADPEPYLNSLFYEVMKNNDDEVDIPAAVLYSFSNCGKGFFQDLEVMKPDEKAWYLSSSVGFPNHLVIATSDHEPHWTLPPKDSFEQLMHFLFFLRRTMLFLANHPIGEQSTQSAAEVAQHTINLPKRTAFVRAGETVTTIEIDETPEIVSATLLAHRKQQIREQTRKKYCQSADKVEEEIRQRLIKWQEEKPETPLVETDEQPPEIPEPAKPTPIVTLQTERKEPEIQLPASRDASNVLYAQLQAKTIDPDTTILASLGDYYVLTIRQWMRLFGWKSYPRATQYFKELKDQDYIFRKDREGRGGTLVAGDWFLLLTKGAKELEKRKQPEPRFPLEPNEAGRLSGDTLLHTYLVNELLIHLRLLEREQLQLVTIEEIIHERSMRRQYGSVLGTDAKFYPDSFLRLFVPTANGLKRRSIFLELQNTTQKDKANWQVKVRKYISLFSSADTLEKFFHTKTPQILVITRDEHYAAYHQHWTEEVLTSVGDNGENFRNRFLIAAYDTGISDMTVPPFQFFCTPRFFVPFADAPHALFDVEKSI